MELRSARRFLMPESPDSRLRRDTSKGFHLARKVDSGEIVDAWDGQSRCNFGCEARAMLFPVMPSKLK